MLFESAAESAGKSAVAVLLTGIGTDGAKGMLKIQQAGGKTIAQDEATFAISGMPKAATFQSSSFSEQLPLSCQRLIFLIEAFLSLLIIALRHKVWQRICSPQRCCFSLFQIPLKISSLRT